MQSLGRLTPLTSTVGWKTAPKGYRRESKMHSLKPGMSVVEPVYANVQNGILKRAKSHVIINNVYAFFPVVNPPMPSRVVNIAVTRSSVAIRY